MLGTNYAGFLAKYLSTWDSEVADFLAVFSRQLSVHASLRHISHAVVDEDIRHLHAIPRTTYSIPHTAYRTQHAAYKTKEQTQEDIIDGRKEERSK
jgi:hypothetical protein